jgi:predicted dehydrogenase
MARIGVGLIGTGFMGKCHALAYGSVKAVFGDVPVVERLTLCDVEAGHAARCAHEFGFAGSTTHWRDLLSDPAIGLISITAPNGLHREIAIAALEAGKHVWCEKPMALTLGDAQAMAEAAAAAPGQATALGYGYLRNPALQHARSLIAEGAIGEVFDFAAASTRTTWPTPTCPGRGV